MLSEKQVTTLQKTVVHKEEQHATVFFQAMGDMTRFRIVDLLSKNKGENLCVTDLARIIGCSLPTISQHMRILERANIVKKQRQGKMACYQLNFSQPFVRGIVALIENNN